MRPPLLLLALVLILPLAAAQGTHVRVEVEPLDAPLDPESPAELTFRVNVECLPQSPDAAARTVHVWVADAPTWLEVDPKPAISEVDPSTCTTSSIVVEGILALRATSEAPAGRLTRVTLLAAAEGFGDNATGATTFDVEPGYFAMLDVSAGDSIAIVPPGGTHTFVVRVSNHGNDATRVWLETLGGTRGVNVTLPPPVTLDSQQQGGAATSAELAVAVTAARAVGYKNEPTAVSLRVMSARVGSEEPNSADTVTVLLTTKGFDAPPAPPVAWAAAVVAAALVTRRVRARR